MTTSDESLINLRKSPTSHQWSTKALFTLRGSHSLPSLTSHLVLPLHHPSLPVSYTARHTPASGSTVTSLNILPAILLYFKSWLMLPSYWNLSWSVWFVHWSIPQCLEWCLSQVDPPKILTDWMNEWANWLSHPVHLGGGPTTSPEWSKITQIVATLVTLDQKDKLTSDTPWPMVQCGAQKSSKLMEHRCLEPESQVARDRWPCTTKQLATETELPDHDGHPDLENTTLVEDPNTPEGQNLRTGRPGHKGLSLYPHHHSTSAQSSDYRSPTPGWEEGQGWGSEITTNSLQKGSSLIHLL